MAGFTGGHLGDRWGCLGPTAVATDRIGTLREHLKYVPRAPEATRRTLASSTRLSRRCGKSADDQKLRGRHRTKPRTSAGHGVAWSLIRHAGSDWGGKVVDHLAGLSLRWEGGDGFSSSGSRAGGRGFRWPPWAVDTRFAQATFRSRRLAIQHPLARWPGNPGVGRRPPPPLGTFWSCPGATSGTSVESTQIHR